MRGEHGQKCLLHPLVTQLSNPSSKRHGGGVGGKAAGTPSSRQQRPLGEAGAVSGGLQQDRKEARGLLTPTQQRSLPPSHTNQRTR